MSHFWDISLANLVTWLILIAGFVGSQYVAVKLLGQRMNGFDEWRKETRVENKARDLLIGDLKVATEKLTVLATAAERRLERLEDH